jgi:hypothetical protein
LLYNWWNLGEK